MWVYVRIEEDWVNTLDEILSRVKKEDDTFDYKFVKDEEGKLFVLALAQDRRKAHWRGVYLKKVILDRFGQKRDYGILEEDVVEEVM